MWDKNYLILNLIVWTHREEKHLVGNNQAGLGSQKRQTTSFVTLLPQKHPTIEEKASEAWREVAGFLLLSEELVEEELYCFRAVGERSWLALHYPGTCSGQDGNFRWLKSLDQLRHRWGHEQGSKRMLVRECPLEPELELAVDQPNFRGVFGEGSRIRVSGCGWSGQSDHSLLHCDHRTQIYNFKK